MPGPDRRGLLTGLVKYWADPVQPASGDDLLAARLGPRRLVVSAA